MRPRELVEATGGRFSVELGIDLSSLQPNELFKWLLASLLFGARISRKIAGRTYRSFEKHDALSIESILAKGWQDLVEILDKGGYARYDFKTAAKLLEVAENLKSRYGGDLNRLHSESSGPADLENRLMALGKGIGPVTTNIFLREMRGLWEKAQPALSRPAIIAARELGYLPEHPGNEGRTLLILTRIWADSGTFPDFEAALLKWWMLKKGRPGKNWRRHACKIAENRSDEQGVRQETGTRMIPGNPSPLCICACPRTLYPRKT